MGTCHELTTCSLLWFLKTNLRSVPCEIIQLYEIRLENLIPKITLVPRQVPTGTTDTTRTVTESQCCASTRLHAPVYPGCEMHICALVMHGCVEWGLVSTQDRHKYYTCQPSFCTGNTNRIQTSTSPRFVFGFSRTKRRLACIIYNDILSYLPSYLDIVLNVLCLITADILASMRYHIYQKDFSKISPAWVSCKFMCYAIKSLLYITLAVPIRLCPDNPGGDTH